MTIGAGDGSPRTAASPHCTSIRGTGEIAIR
jgi:hypothetical protein